MKQLYVTFLLCLIFIAPLFGQRTALFFDGTDDYLSVSGNSKLNGLSNLTLETWIYTDNFNTSPCADCAPIIWNQNNGYRFGTGNTRLVKFSLYNGTAAVTLSSSLSLATNTWHHIAGTYDGSKMKIYVDGVATDSNSSAFTITYTSSTSDIWIADPQTGWGGILEETRIWDYARSAAQIKEGMRKNYKSGLSGLVLHFDYEDGTAYKNNSSVSKVNDRTSNKNHGTIYNFKLTDTVSNFVIGRSYCDTPVYAKLNASQCVKYTLPSKKRTVTTSGTYMDTIVSVKGCDSIMTINVTILTPTSGTTSVSACDSFRNSLNGLVYRYSGKYVATSRNAAGCDSVITFNVTIYKKDTTVYNYNACNKVILKNGKTVTSTGTYYDQLKGKNGCDSTVVHKATIRHQSTSKATLRFCQFVLCPSTKTKVFYKAGTYYDTIPNKIGCDSVIEYTVVSKSTSNTLTVTSCSTYVSPSKKYQYSKSGIYHDTLFSANYENCDSFITLNLTIANPKAENLEVTRCKSYVVPSGQKIITSSQVVNDKIKSTSGCDSILYTITVTINGPDMTVSKSGNKLISNNSSPSSQFQWLDCDAAYAKISGANAREFAPVKSGKYAVEIRDNSCTDTSNCINLVLGKIATMRELNAQFFPNPNHGEFTIATSETIHSVNIQIYDLQGRVLEEWELRDLSDVKFKTRLKAGLYLVKLSSAEGMTKFWMAVN